MHFLFTLADVGVDLSLAPQVERDRAVDLFQGEGGEILLDRLRALAASEGVDRSEEHTSELQSLRHLVCRLLLEKKTKKKTQVRSMEITASSAHVACRVTDS